MRLTGSHSSPSNSAANQNRAMTAGDIARALGDEWETALGVWKRLPLGCPAYHVVKDALTNLAVAGIIERAIENDGALHLYRAKPEQPS